MKSALCSFLLIPLLIEAQSSIDNETVNLSPIVNRNIIWGSAKTEVVAIEGRNPNYKTGSIMGFDFDFDNTEYIVEYNFDESDRLISYEIKLKEKEYISIQKLWDEYLKFFNELNKLNTPTNVSHNESISLPLERINSLSKKEVNSIFRTLKNEELAIEWQMDQNKYTLRLYTINDSKRISLTKKSQVGLSPIELNEDSLTNKTLLAINDSYDDKFNALSYHLEKAASNYNTGLFLSLGGSALVVVGAISESNELSALGAALGVGGIIAQLIGNSELRNGAKSIKSKKISMRTTRGIGLSYQF